MKIKLKYGKNDLEINISDDYSVEILKTKNQLKIKNLESKIQEILNNPQGTKSLFDLAKGKKTACIVISDITRPVPNKIILTPLLSILEKAGIAKDKILILVATGLHRPSTKDELIEMVGNHIFENYIIKSHFAKNEKDHSFVGKTPDGANAYIDTRYLDADLHIITGLVEPHLLAGYSGGPKAVCPGISDMKTIYKTHRPEYVEHPLTEPGIISDNPFFNCLLCVAKKARVDFAINVTVNAKHELTSAFGGDMEMVHKSAINYIKMHSTVTISQPADIVITTAAGYPLDATLYQSIKGLVAAKPICKKNGVMILAAELAQGLGSPEFIKLAADMDSAQEFLTKAASPDFFYIDQWMFNDLCLVLKDYNAYVYSDKLDDESIKLCLCKPVQSVEAGIKLAAAKCCKNKPRIAIIPEGPYVMPRVY